MASGEMVWVLLVSQVRWKVRAINESVESYQKWFIARILGLAKRDQPVFMRPRRVPDEAARAVGLAWESGVLCAGWIPS